MVSEDPFISVAMMVKNEEEFLAEALDSAQPWADEIIVVDTGSTDRTVEIAKSYGVTLSFFEWCDDFSAARNETLSCANGQWIIILDADERLRGEDPAALRTYLKSRSTGYPFEIVNLKVVNTSLSGIVMSELQSMRIVPNDRRLGYVSRVHNLLVALDPNFPKMIEHRYDQLEIVHFGYDPQVYEARKKGERSLPLIELSVKENPKSALYRYYLGREYFTHKRNEEAIEQLCRAQELFKAKHKTDKHYRKLGFDIAWFLLRSMRAAAKPLKDPLTVARDALKNFPTKPDLWFVTAQILADDGQKEEAIKNFEHALALLDSGVDEVKEICHVETRRAEIYQSIGELSAETGDMNRAYGAFVQALEHVEPERVEQRLTLINFACGLAIDLGDTTNLAVLMELLLQIPEAPLDMFFLGLEAIAEASDRATAVSFLTTAKEAYPHLAEHPKSMVWSLS